MIWNQDLGGSHADREEHHTHWGWHRRDEAKRGTHRCQIGGDVERVGRRDQHHCAHEDPTSEPLTDERAETLARHESKASGRLLNPYRQRQQERCHPQKRQPLRDAHLRVGSDP